MGLFDNVMPSERASDLALVVRRLQRRSGLEVIPVLVVEGRTDEPALGPLLHLGDAQVFSAGTRGLVEQLLVLSDSEPVDGCDCVYLVDCDGRGKSSHLRDRDSLVVTETCDLESDLVKLGVATRVASRYVEYHVAQEMVQQAIAIAVPFSRVRRAAYRAGVSMKRSGTQIPLLDLPGSVLLDWETSAPNDAEIVAAVADIAEWDATTQASVGAEIASVSHDPERIALGKDILDALFRLLARDGGGEVRGWSRDHFRSVVRRELAPSDVAGWVVGRRLLCWSGSRGHQLMVTGSGA